METNEINKINIENNNIEEIDLTTKYICENIDKSIIVFCNPISGNQEGKKIFEISYLPSLRAPFTISVQLPAGNLLSVVAQGYACNKKEIGISSETSDSGHNR